MVWWYRQREKKSPAPSHGIARSLDYDPKVLYILI